MSYSWLPPTLAEIAEHAGLEAALKLADSKGGQRIYVPNRPTPKHWLSELVGGEAAARICERYAGMYVVVPIGPHRGLAAMQRAAEAALDENVSANEAARRSGLHVRRIYARKAKRQAEREPGLFDGPEPGTLPSKGKASR